jgi:hypothetical protein
MNNIQCPLFSTQFYLFMYKKSANDTNKTHKKFNTVGFFVFKTCEFIRTVHVQKSSDHI